MSVQSAPYYWITCDWPGCDATAQDGDYSAWGDHGAAYGEAVNAEWCCTDNEGDFCPEHSTYDEETDERVPLSTDLAGQFENVRRRLAYRLDLLVSRAERAIDMSHDGLADRRVLANPRERRSLMRGRHDG